MSEAPQDEPKPRDKSAIQQEYVQTCTAGGDLQYRILMMKKDLELINQRLYELNKEAAAVPQNETVGSEGPSV